jgi:hypothetical protein
MVLMGCSKSDKELLSGTWSIQQLKKDGVLAMSVDPKEQQKVIDKTWKEQGKVLQQMGIDKATVAKNIQAEVTKLAHITFTFGDNGKVKVSSHEKNAKDTFSAYHMDEDKKQLTIEQSKEDKLVYTYTITDKMLVLKQKKDEISFKRK